MDIDRITATRDVRIHYYIQLISFVILWYDHIITFPLEVKAVWGRPMSANSVLYLVNRYLASAGNAAFLAIGFLTLSDKNCQIASLWGQLLLFANQVMICVLLLIRLYAIYARSRRILISFLLLGAVMIGVVSFSFVNQKSQTLEGYPGCTLAHTAENAIRLAIPWECMLLYDTLVLLLTVMRTYRTTQDRAAVRRATSAVHIPTLILRDGALYFAGMALSNALNIVCFYVTPPLLKGSLSSFNSVMGVTLVSRMVLNLRDVATETHEDSHPSWNTTQTFSRPHFRENPGMELSSIGTIRKPSVTRGAVPGHDWNVELDDLKPVIDISHSVQATYSTDGLRGSAYC